MKDEMENPIILITSSDEEGSGCREKRKECGGLMIRSKVDEYKEIADLGGFQNLRAMILAEAFVRRKKRNRKKKKKRKIESWHKEVADWSGFENPRAMIEAEAFMKRKKRNRKKSKTEFYAQDDITDNEAKVKGQLGNGEALNVVEVSKASFEEEKEGDGSKKKRRSEGSKRSKLDEYKRISDLSGFENLKAMILAEASMRRKKRCRKKRKGKIKFCARENVSVNAEEEKGKLAEAEALKIVEEVSKPESVPISEVDEPQNLVNDAAKEIEGERMVKAVQMTTREADDGVNAVEVIDFCLLSSEDDQSLSDVNLGKSVEDMGKAVQTTEAAGVDGGVNAVETIELCSSPLEDDKSISDARLCRSVEDVVPVAPVLKEKRGRRRRRRKKSKVIMAKDNIDDAKEENDVKFNVVFRMFLRKPRYFDPPVSLLVTCSNCGEESHTAVRCTSRKRNKPCFLCGSLEHTWKNCMKGQDCFISNGRDYRANGCPETDQANDSSSNICLRCGDSGHDMFSCRGDYTADDLKEIQCYVCKSFGHLCCVNSLDIGPEQVSCYNCGQSGHLGPVCTNSCEAPGRTQPSIVCYKRGEEGHFAHRCSSHVKDRLRISDLLSTAERLPSRARICIGSNSPSPGLCKTY